MYRIELNTGNFCLLLGSVLHPPSLTTPSRLRSLRPLGCSHYTLFLAQLTPRLHHHSLLSTRLLSLLPLHYTLFPSAPLSSAQSSRPLYYSPPHLFLASFQSLHPPSLSTTPSSLAPLLGLLHSPLPQLTSSSPPLLSFPLPFTEFLHSTTLHYPLPSFLTPLHLPPTPSTPFPSSPLHHYSLHPSFHSISLSSSPLHVHSTSLPLPPLPPSLRSTPLHLLPPPLLPPLIFQWAPVHSTATHLFLLPFQSTPHSSTHLFLHQSFTHASSTHSTPFLHSLPALTPFQVLHPLLSHLFLARSTPPSLPLTLLFLGSTHSTHSAASPSSLAPLTRLSPLHPSAALTAPSSLLSSLHALCSHCTPLPLLHSLLQSSTHYAALTAPSSLHHPTPLSCNTTPHLCASGN
ncbi:proline-rich protein 36-like [Haliotis rubra]|uniref:proline-rich protein 36-like n=1 Tax=Haliotis rubra TaxID=36100 RepID=UPI001EE50AD6|nr:proline-rich protein 36-like [Haliotis rubra]